MKKLNLSTVVAFFGLLITIVGCSASGTVSQDESEEINPADNWTLKDHLRRATGVRISGSPGNTRVMIRGESSVINPTNQPLFVIDGQKAGRNFSRVNKMLYPGEITSIDVLPASESSIYGMEGNFGVVEIHTVSEQH